MNLDKYKNSGFGLGKIALINLRRIIENNKIERIIEFGSGISTEFLSDLSCEFNKSIKIVSFEDSLKYSYKIKDDDPVDLKIRKLVECSDESFEKMFKEKKYINNLMFSKKSKLSTKQKNNFYDIKDDDINGFYDLVILDGANGNGRSLSFLHLKNHLKSNTYVLIDDFNHYDFVEKFLSIFNAKRVFELDNRYDVWEKMGQFVIYKIL